GRLFERPPQFEQVADVVGVDAAHDGHAGGLLFDESLGGEPRDGFTQRGAAHTETGGLLDLPQHGAGCERARLDLVEQDRISAITRLHAHLLDHTHRLSVYIRPTKWPAAPLSRDMAYTHAGLSAVPDARAGP